MAIFEMTPTSLRPIDPTTFGEANVKERGDLQRLLRSQIDVVIPDVLVIAEEFADWEDSKRRIDLLGLDREANLVVIELKRTEDGGHMELQAVRYAAMVSAMTFEKAVDVYGSYLSRLGQPADARAAILKFLRWEEADEDRFAQDVKIVLVSAEFSKELTTTVMWLNEHEMDIRCVRMKPYRDDGRLLIDVQQVIPLPEAADYIVRIKEKEVRERTARREQSALENRLVRFWTGLLERSAPRTEMHRRLTPPTTNWFVDRFDGTGIGFSYVVGPRTPPRVEAYLAGLRKGTDPKIVFDKLFADRDGAEGRFGEPLQWQRLDGNIASRICFQVKAPPFDDETAWPTLQDGMIEAMIRFEKALRPAINNLGL